MQVVALSYNVLDDTQPTSLEYHIVYDMGASTTSATLFTIQPTNPPKSTKSKVISTKKSENTLSILATSYNRHLGGDDFDRNLQSVLVNKFVAMYEKEDPKAKDIVNDERAMKTLMAETKKLKQNLNEIAKGAFMPKVIKFELAFHSITLFFALTIWLVS